MASIRAHGGGFQVRYYSDGVPQCEQFETIDKAQLRVKEIAYQKAQGLTVEARPHTVKFDELAKAVVDDYDNQGHRSRDDIEARFRLHLIPVFGKRKAISITARNIDVYIKSRKAEGASVGSINRELEAMKRAFRLGIEQRTVAHMPVIKLLKENNVRTGFFTREEVDRLCSQLSDPFGRFVVFAFLTAWRYDEIRNLKWTNIDFDRGEIRLDPGTTKSGEGRVFPLTSELRNLLKPPVESIVRIAQKRRAVTTISAYVFTRHGKQIGQFRKRWNTACRAAGLPVVLDENGRVIKSVRLFHDLRRSGVRELARILGERRAMVRTGHKTRSVFDRYNVVSDADLLDDRRALDDAHAVTPSKVR